MMKIEHNIFGAILAFIIGAAISAASYGISRRVLQKNPSGYVAVQVGKQILQVLFLVLLFVLGNYTPWSKIWLLVGGCLGITLPMFWFTYQLVKLNDSLHGKEDSSNG